MTGRHCSTIGSIPLTQRVSAMKAYLAVYAGRIKRLAFI